MRRAGNGKDVRTGEPAVIGRQQFNPHELTVTDNIFTQSDTAGLDDFLGDRFDAVVAK
ncbi:MAG: hypothetical protein ACD_75C01518G0004 [uncultured bacterium]|nr:MAG: hypothetical protein ACD_75C01518G0004 [uncultured bacterium]